MKWVSNQKTIELSKKLEYLLPKDFDYQTYINLHDDLVDAGIDDYQKAKEHYLFFGIKEKRAYKEEELLPIDISNSYGEKFFDSKNILYFSPTAPDYDLSSGGNRLLEILKILKLNLAYNIYFLCNDPLSEKYINKLHDLDIRCYSINIEHNHYLDRHIEAFKQNNLHFDYAIFSWYDIARQYIDIVKDYYPNIKTIVDSVDVHWLRETRGAGLKQILYNDFSYNMKKVAEKNTYLKADVVFAVTHNDKLEIYKELGYNLNIKILSNIHEPYDINTIGENILFIGNYNHKPNVQAALESIDIYKEFINSKEWKKHKPSLIIAGANISNEIVVVASKVNGVKILGYVENLEDVYSQSMVSMSPLYWGAGIKGKICDSAMRSLVILTSDIGNEGIGLRDGHDAYIANSKTEFISKLKQIYSSDKETIDRIRFGGKSTIEKIVSKKSAISVLEHTLQAKHIVISIVAYKNYEKLKTCIESIIDKAGYPNYTIVITDNSSTSNNKNIVNKILKKYKHINIEYIKNKTNEYFIAPNNAIMRNSKYKNSDVLLINDDIEILSNNFLAVLYSAAYSSNDVGAVGGKTIFPNGKLAEAGAELYQNGTGRNIGRGQDPDDETYNIPKYVGYCSGCLLYMKREVIDQIGCFDETLEKLYYEDSEWQYRAHVNGYKTLYQPLCVAIHNEGSSAGTDITSGAKRYQEINRIKFVDKYKNYDIEKYNS